jgi:hypothetical protein
MLLEQHLRQRLGHAEQRQIDVHAVKLLPGRPLASDARPKRSAEGSAPLPGPPDDGALPEGVYSEVCEELAYIPLEQ